MLSVWFFEKVFCQPRNIFTTFFERWTHDRKRVNAVEKIFTKLPASYRHLQFLIRRYNHSMSIGMLIAPPTRWISRSWSTRNNLVCRTACISPVSSRKIVHPLALSNFSDSSHCRSHENPRFMSAKLAFNKRFRNGSRIDSAKWARS